MIMNSVVSTTGKSASSLARAVSKALSKNATAAGRRHPTRIVRYASSATSSSPWADYEMAPFDPIIGLTEQFKMDDFPQKVNVGVGAYRSDDGKPYVLPCVREAERRMMAADHDMEYTGIAGDPDFVDSAFKFQYGDECEALTSKRIQGVQTLSGTGGLAVFGKLIERHGHKEIYVPDPTWGNHHAIFKLMGLKVKTYRYYDPSKSAIDFDAMMEDLKNIPEGSVVLLHACAHNPTGMDPNLEQWKQISDTMKTGKLFPFFDSAYQGFASGNAVTDAASVRMFVNDGHYMAVVQSFSKNFGLYGHRVGALSFVGADADEAARVVSQTKLVIRPMYSNPPRHGAMIVKTIFSDPELTNEYLTQCKGMADRINNMRIVLRTKLEDAGSKHDWSHISNQIGMFAYSGLTKDQVMKMREKHHIYCTLDGRISMAGVTSGNVEYLAHAMHDVSK